MVKRLGSRRVVFTIFVAIEDKKVTSVDLWGQIKSTKNSIDDVLNNGAEV